MRVARAVRRSVAGWLFGALAGTIVSTAMLTEASPIYDWMFLRHYGDGVMLGVAKFARDVAIRFLVLAIAFAGGLWAATRILQRMFGRAHPAVLVAFVGLLGFAGAFGEETLWGLAGGSGNLHAADAGGATVDEGRLTPHGWNSAFRRACAAGATALVMAGAYAATVRPRRLP